MLECDTDQNEVLTPLLPHPSPEEQFSDDCNHKPVLDLSANLTDKPTNVETLMPQKLDQAWSLLQMKTS